MQRFFHTLCVFSIAAMGWVSTVPAVSPGQADDFQDGTVQGWGGNRLGTLVNVADGGPLGPGDRYFEVAISGFHLGTVNTNQWTGDYLAAGIEAIEMDLNRYASSTSEVRIRILLFGPGGTFASTQLTPPITTNAWSHHVFGLTTNDLVHVPGSFKVSDGTGVLEDTLQNVTELLIRHDGPTPTIPGHHPPHVAATLGVDSIRAVIRPPSITGFQVAGGVASVSLGNLVAGTSNVVEASERLVDPDWASQITFTASSDSTNLNTSVTADTGYLRVRLP